MGRMKEEFMKQREKYLDRVPCPVEMQLPVIISARITDMPTKMFDPMPSVYVTLEDGTEEFLFDYYPDEISFTPMEFRGLTIPEARQLKFKKDRDYLTT